MATEGIKKLEELHLNKIQRRVEEIGQHVWTRQINIRDVSVAETMEHLSLEQAKKLPYKPVKGGFRWGKPWSTAWFRLRFSLPAAYKGYAGSLLFNPRGECIIFRDGLPVQGLDLNRQDYVLMDKAKGNERMELYVEAGASDAFGNFQARIMDQPKVAIVLPEMWQGWYDLRCLLEMVSAGTHWTGAPEQGLAEESTRRARILFGLNKTVDLFDYRDLSLEGLCASARRISKALKPLYACPAESSAQTIACLGHAHIDVAWLWPLAETIRKCGRTFSNVLELMDRYPEFVFCQSQPHLYEFTRDRYPSLYKRIKDKVKQGQWDPAGCTWVEMDCNITGGESLVRQILFGTRFFKQEFNLDACCLWMPDVFGYSGALPQLLKRSGVDYFLTQKISLSQFTTFPHHTFYWEGIDGTKILSHFLPANDYNAKLRGSEAITAAGRYKQKDRSPIHAVLFGFGDGGGGPTKDMIERMRRYKNLEGVPKLQPMSHRKFFQRLERESVELPTWTGDLYLENHRGTLTTQAANKRFNRQCELLLRETEMLSAINLSSGGTYAQKELNAAWKTVLLNQFHDIIPGSSIEKVYTDSKKDYTQVIESTQTLKDQAFSHLAKLVDTRGEGTPVVAFNSLSWDRNDVIAVEVPGLRKGQLLSAMAPDGTQTPAQVGVDGKVRFTGMVPSVGHSVFHLRPTSVKFPVVKADEKILENDCLRVKFNAEGCLTSVFDKSADREVLADGESANQFILFEDKPVVDDAWDVDIFFNDKPLERSGEILSVEVVETGPVRSVVRTKRRISRSVIRQDVILSAGSKRLDFETTVDWGDEEHVLLKVAFPVNVRSDSARYDIQFGSIERPTHWNTPRDFAQFEVPGHKWIDLSESDYGVALLNDCKYGHDIRNHVMRMTILRAPKYPDPTADVNQTHKLTYSLLPHTGNFTQGVIQQAYQLNAPITALTVGPHPGPVAARVSNFDISGENIIIETVKKAEDDNGLIVRMYEAHGSRGTRTFHTSLPVQRIFETDLMEKEENRLTPKDGTVKLSFTPFQIRTLKLIV
ncbi:MAG: alpha-mannosidase [Phycisphaerae bacterium]